MGVSGLTASDTAATGLETECRSRPQSATCLKLNILWTVLSIGAYSGSQWLTLIALAKIGSIEFVGEFALANAVASAMVIILGMQMRTMQASDAKQRFTLGEYLGLRVVSLGLAIPVVAFVGLHYQHDRSVTACVLAMVLYRAIESIGDVYCGAAQQKQQMGVVAVSMMLKGPLAAIAFLAVIGIGGSLELGILSMAAVGSVVLLGYDLPQAARRQGITLWQAATPAIDRQRTLQLARNVLPIGIGAIAFTLYANIPRFLIEAADGKAALGAFAAIMSLLSATHLVQSSIGQAVLPKLSQYFATGNRQECLRLASFVAATALISSFTVVFVSSMYGEGMLTAIYDAEFAEHHRLLIGLAIVSSLQCFVGCFSMIFHAIQEFRAASFMQVSGCLAGTVVSVFLIPSEGMWGAPWSMGIGMVTSLLIGAAIFGQNIWNPCK